MRTLVYLIGTGPGGPWLITVRGRRCLETADVVIHDRTVHPRVLDLAPPYAERIDVGRRVREHADQDAISYLLAEKAREGKVVARLKQGDPFVFDRGGEEALFLHEQGIPFEVVPGVPVALGGAAYAGIPLTYAGGGDALVFLRAGDAGGDQGRGRWTPLARLDGTIVSHGDHDDLRRVVEELVAHGRPKDDTAALIGSATLASQETSVGTLQDVAARLAEPAADGPKTLVVGKVVGLREHLRWFDERPLFGRRVLVTRSRHQAGELVELLEAAGAEAVEAPVFRVAEMDDFDVLDLALDTASQCDWIVFTTVSGVEGFMSRLVDRGRDARSLAGPRFCAAGVGTAARLARFGVRVELAVEGQDVETIVAALGVPGGLAGRRVLLPAAAGVRDALTEPLTAAGADVRHAPSYRTLAVEDNPDIDVYGQLLQHRIDVVTFTSAAAVRGFAALHGEEQVADLLSHTAVAAVGPAAVEATRRLGVAPAIVPPVPTISALVDAIRAHFQ